MRRVTTLLYGLACYAIFLVTFVYAIGFVNDLVVPRTVDEAISAPLLPALLIDVALLGLFAVQHSVMARPGFKAWWTRIVPKSVERSTYVLLASLALALVFWQWREIPAVVWNVEGTVAEVALRALRWVGWGIVLASTFMIDHLRLFGVKQVLARLRGSALPLPRFTTPLLYKLVRHPIMLGFLIAFWATPTMTAGHLLFAAATTGYILIGVRLEERDLVALFGEDYERYRRRTPAFVPALAGGAREPRREDRQAPAGVEAGDPAS